MAFTPEQKAVLYGGANRVAEIMKDSWWQHEAQEFMNNEFAKFMADNAAANTAISQEDDPDKMVAAFQGYKNQTLMPFFQKMGVKYAKNPYITATLKQTFDGVAKSINEMVAPMQAAEAFTGREEKAARAREVEDVGLDLKRAQTKQAEASAGHSTAQTSLLRDKQANPGKYMQPTKGAKADQGWIPPGTHPSQWRSLARNPENVEKFTEHYIGPTSRDLALEALQKRGLMGKKRPGLDGGTWGDNPGTDATMALGNGWVTREQINKEADVRFARDHGAWTGAPDPALLIYPDLHQEETARPPGSGMVGTIDNNQMITRFFGQGASAHLSAAEVDMGDLSAVTAALPRSIEELEAGPVKNAIQAAILSAEPAPQGGFKLGFLPPDQSVADEETLMLKMREYLDEVIIKPSIGGREIEDDELDENTRRARVKARIFMELLLDKYEDEIASGVGIEHPGMSLLKKKLGESAVGQAASAVGGAVSGLFGSVGSKTTKVGPE